MSGPRYGHAFDTPARFVACVVSVKMAAWPLVLYFSPKDYECSVEFTTRKRRPGTVKVGQYGPGGGRGLARVMRDDLEAVIRRAIRGTNKTEIDSEG